MTKQLALAIVRKVKRDLENGGWVEVVCKEDAHRGGTALRGHWEFISVEVAENGSQLRQSVVILNTIERKVVKTIVGLSSFAASLGVFNPQIPLRAGRIGIWKIDEEDRKTATQAAEDLADESPDVEE
tara:strand:+ start:530 stop:913 length:384 start_codon:yes stop_codon:yes gene_type:complete